MTAFVHNIIDTTTADAPCYAGVPLAVVVHHAHEAGIDAAIAGGGTRPAVSREALERLLIYCAERRCEADGVTCPGCRLRTQRDDVVSLDGYAVRFGEITTDSGLRVSGGAGPAHPPVPSLDHLAKTWAGEEYWFWARRALRKVRYGVRKSDDLFDDAVAAADGPSVILVEPQIAENVGMVARAMANFGLDDMRVINPRDGWPSEKARAVASGASAIVDGASVHCDLRQSIADMHYVVATTARQRDMRKPILTPEQAAAEMRTRIAAGQKCAYLFGRERNGLQSDEIADAHAVVMIPVNPKFASLNLAQAVLLLSYAWLRSGDEATLGRVTVHDRHLQPGLHLGHDVPAKNEELQGFFGHLERLLDERGFFSPPERRHVTVRNLRSMFLRLGATAQEVRTLRGILATLTRKPRGGQQDGE